MLKLVGHMIPGTVQGVNLVKKKEEFDGERVNSRRQGIFSFYYPSIEFNAHTHKHTGTSRNIGTVNHLRMVLYRKFIIDSTQSQRVPAERSVKASKLHLVLTLTTTRHLLLLRQWVQREYLSRVVRWTRRRDVVGVVRCVRVHVSVHVFENINRE